MRSYFAALRRLVLPAGAPPGTPMIVLGPDVPPTLAALSPDFTWASAIVYYFNATDYYFEAVGTWNPFGTQVVVTGTYDTVNGVVIYTFIRLGFNELSIGSPAYSQALLTTAFKVPVSIGDAFTIDGESAPRGLVGRVDSVLPSAAIGAEAVVFTIPNVTLRTGRAFEVRAECENTVGAVPATGVYRVRKTDLAGAVWRIWVTQPDKVGSDHAEMSTKIKNITGASVTGDIALTLQGVGNVVTMDAGVTFPREFEVWDVGAAAKFPNAFPVA